MPVFADPLVLAEHSAVAAATCAIDVAMAGMAVWQVWVLLAMKPPDAPRLLLRIQG